MSMKRQPESIVSCPASKLTFEIRRTSIIRGKSFKLFVISTIMTQRDTVMRIEPPRKDAAPRRAYLKFQQKMFRRL